MDTRSYIRDNYNKLLSKAKTMKNFDEDVFQNTIFYIIINSERFTEETIYNYILRALRINFIRERKYARYKTTNDIPDNLYMDDDNIDISIIETMVEDRFGRDLYECYKLHRDGYSVEEIKQTFPHIKNLRNKIKHIENYTRDIILN
jgi:hypothetical protein